MKAFLSMVMAGLMAAPCSLDCWAFTPTAATVSALDDGVYTVTSASGTFGEVMLRTTEDWENVVELTVKGSMNREDMAYFSRMKNLKKLDLSQTDITTIGGCAGLSSLQTVVLPNTLKTVEKAAFYNCTTLKGGLSLPNVTAIGDLAFASCDSLATVDLPKVETIGVASFAMGKDYYNDNHNNLASVNMPNVKSIGRAAFLWCNHLSSVSIPDCVDLDYYEESYDYDYEYDIYGYREYGCFQNCSGLVSVVLSDNLESIPASSFYGTALNNFVFPASLKYIGSGAFAGTQFTSIVIPEGVTSIGGGAFRGCPLTEITLPSSVCSIGDEAFLCYNVDADYYWGTRTYTLKDVRCKIFSPMATSTFQGENVKNATLHVPAISLASYRLNENWSQFGQIVATEGVQDDVRINSAFSMVDNAGLAEKATLTLAANTSGSAGHLTINATSALAFGTFVQEQNFTRRNDYVWDEDGEYEIYSYPYCTTLTPYSDVRADKVVTRISLPAGRWSFVSFPHDVNVSDIKVPEGTLWVVRKYNGANRAAMTGDTWEDVPRGQMLKAGEGYIIHCINENGGDYWYDDYYYYEGGLIEFEFPAVNNANKNKVFAYGDVTRTLQQYPSEFAHNRDWNLTGNPYPAYYDCKHLDFAAPITVWNGNGYTAYSLADDEYVLHPNEAFFVQRPLAGGDIRFLAKGRTHDYKLKRRVEYRAKALAASGRQILNFVLSDDQHSDRARLVVNEAASADYETTCDASKFMSSEAGVPQIYLIDGGINYAIDERPMGSGKFSLGVRTGSEGIHAISLNGKNLGCKVMLTDNETCQTVDLTEGTYTFAAQAQTYTRRFTIELQDESTTVEATEAAKTAAYCLNGNTLTFLGVGASATIVSASGQTVFEGAPAGTIALPHGVYVITIDNETHKIAVK